MLTDISVFSVTDWPPEITYLSNAVLHKLDKEVFFIFDHGRYVNIHAMKCLLCDKCHRKNPVLYTYTAFNPCVHVGDNRVIKSTGVKTFPEKLYVQTGGGGVGGGRGEGGGGKVGGPCD